MEHQTTAEIRGMEQTAIEALVFTMEKISRQPAAGEGITDLKKYAECHPRILRVSGCEVGRAGGKGRHSGRFFTVDDDILSRSGDSMTLTTAVSAFYALIRHGDPCSIPASEEDDSIIDALS